MGCKGVMKDALCADRWAARALWRTPCARIDGLQGRYEGRPVRG